MTPSTRRQHAPTARSPSSPDPGRRQYHDLMFRTKKPGGPGPNSVKVHYRLTVSSASAPRAAQSREDPGGREGGRSKHANLSAFSHSGPKEEEVEPRNGGWMASYFEPIALRHLSQYPCPLTLTSCSTSWFCTVVGLLSTSFPTFAIEYCLPVSVSIEL